MLMISLGGVSAYPLNGTATGNILINGSAAAVDDLEFFADGENGWALTLRSGGEDVVVDEDNAAAINICGDKVYYLSIDGVARTTSLRCYDMGTAAVTTLYSVDLGEGLKDLYVFDGEVLFLSADTIQSYDLASGAVTTKLSDDIRDFVPVDGGYVYTVNGKAGLYYYADGQSRRLAADVVSFDCDETSVYYSDGKKGVYRLSLNGGAPQRVGDGGKNIVCADDLYWQKGDTVYSLGGGAEASAVDGETDSFAVISGDVTVSEDVVMSARMAPTYRTAATAAVGLPSGEYKNWKQSDSRWGGNSLGSTTIARSGCLVTSISILLVGSGAEKDRYMNGSFDPGVFVKELSRNGGLTGGGGVVWAGIQKTEPLFSVFRDTRNGSTFESLSNASKATAIKGHLEQGRFVVICVHNPSTGNTHWVAADYVDGSDVLICDPGYRSKTGHLFTDYATVQRAVIFDYSGTGWGGVNAQTNTATPKISAKDVAAGKQVTITCATAGATIYYTLDGSTPTTSSTKYTGAFTLPASEDATSRTLKAIAVAPGYNNSIVASASLLIWKNIYGDVKESDWYYESVAKVSSYGLFFGLGQGVFAPNKNMTRAEFANVMPRLLPAGSDEFQLDPDFSEYIGIKDMRDVNDAAWYAACVYWALAKEIMFGTADDAFTPNDPITRQEICVILVRLAGHMGVSLKETEAAVNFSDSNKIAPWAKDGVAKAQRAGLIYGKSKTKLDPTGTATRAEVAAMILRLMEKM